MKKSMLNLGKALDKAEQKNIFGGLSYPTKDNGDCDHWNTCCGPDNPCPTIRLIGNDTGYRTGTCNSRGYCDY